MPSALAEALAQQEEHCMENQTCVELHVDIVTKLLPFFLFSSLTRIIKYVTTEPLLQSADPYCCHFSLHFSYVLWP